MLKKLVKNVIQHKNALDAYRYHIDCVDDNVISGWAHKIGDGNYTATIEIRANNLILFTTNANVAREDLKAAAIGSGQYGFLIDPKKIKPEQDIIAIDIFIDGLKANVKPLPLTLSAPLSNKIEHQFHVDNVSVEKVIGWVKKKSSITHRSFVELKVGNVVIGDDTANTFRQSIKSAGIGDGRYCFEINPAIHLFPCASVNCDLYIDGKKVNTKPMALTVTEQALETAKFSEQFSGELATFGSSVTQEIQRLTDEISTQNGNAVNVAIENIASLTVRVEVIEKILTRHFASQ